MATTTRHTILLRANGAQEREKDDGIVAATKTITPGMLVIWASGYLSPTGSAADADCPLMVAVEDEYIVGGHTTDETIDHAYAAAEKCYFIYPQPGDRLNMFIEAGHAAVVKGAPLESNGAGYLQAYSSGRILVFADEDVDNSGGGTAARIAVRVA